MIMTEYTFELPNGYVDPSGNNHKIGTMRLATARDEIEPLRDPSVKQNDAYLGVVLLSRVVTRLGDITDVTREVIEELYTSDFDHLQKVYERINTSTEAVGSVTCPHCTEEFEVDLSEIEDGRLGE